jgi:hypothetical protein
MAEIFKEVRTRPDQKLSARRKRLKWVTALVGAVLAALPLNMRAHCYRTIRDVDIRYQFCVASDVRRGWSKVMKYVYYFDYFDRIPNAACYDTTSPCYQSRVNEYGELTGEFSSRCAVTSMRYAVVASRHGVVHDLLANDPDAVLFINARYPWR